MGVSEATFYNWKKKFGGARPLGVATIAPARREMQSPQAAGRRPVAGQGDVAGRTGKKALKPSRRRLLLDDLMKRYGIGVTHANTWPTVKMPTSMGRKSPFLIPTNSGLGSPHGDINNSASTWAHLTSAPKFLTIWR